MAGKESALRSAPQPTTVAYRLTHNGVRVGDYDARADAEAAAAHIGRSLGFTVAWTAVMPAGMSYGYPRPPGALHTFEIEPLTELPPAQS